MLKIFRPLSTAPEIKSMLLSCLGVWSFPSCTQPLKHTLYFIHTCICTSSSFCIECTCPILTPSAYCNVIHPSRPKLKVMFCMSLYYLPLAERSLPPPHPNCLLLQQSKHLSVPQLVSMSETGVLFMQDSWGQRFWLTHALWSPAGTGGGRMRGDPGGSERGSLWRSGGADRVFIRKKVLDRLTKLGKKGGSWSQVRWWWRGDCGSA